MQNSLRLKLEKKLEEKYDKNYIQFNIMKKKC